MANLNTFGAVLRFAIELETHSINFYEDVARYEKCSAVKTVFLTLAQENDRIKKTLERVRQENITDAYETGYVFTDLQRSDYTIEGKLSPEISCRRALRHALKIEENAYEFYLDSAAKARHLLSDISKLFTRLAKEKANHRVKLKSHYDRGQISTEEMHKTE